MVARGGIEAFCIPLNCKELLSPRAWKLPPQLPPRWAALEFAIEPPSDFMQLQRTTASVVRL